MERLLLDQKFYTANSVRCNGLKVTPCTTAVCTVCIEPAERGMGNVALHGVPRNSTLRHLCVGLILDVDAHLCLSTLSPHPSIPSASSIFRCCTLFHPSPTGTQLKQLSNPTLNMSPPDSDTILHVLSRCEACQAGQVRGMLRVTGCTWRVSLFGHERLS